MTTGAQLVTGVDFVPFSTEDLDSAMDFYGTKLGLPRSVYVPERQYAEFETGDRAKIRLVHDRDLTGTTRASQWSCPPESAIVAASLPTLTLPRYRQRSPPIPRLPVPTEAGNADDAGAADCRCDDVHVPPRPCWSSVSEGINHRTAHVGSLEQVQHRPRARFSHQGSTNTARPEVGDRRSGDAVSRERRFELAGAWSSPPTWLVLSGSGRLGPSVGPPEMPASS
jgi:hypothetical protein